MQCYYIVKDMITQYSTVTHAIVYISFRLLSCQAYFHALHNFNFLLINNTSRDDMLYIYGIRQWVEVVMRYLDSYI